LTRKAPERASPGLGTVVLVSTITSAVVSGAMLLGVQVGGSLVGGEPVAVPDVVGMSPEGAGAVLRERGLRLLVDGEMHDSDVEPGEICAQEPGPSSHVPPDTMIHVHTSSGPEPIPVPALAGRMVAEAERAIREAGLVVGEVTEEEGDGEPGTVVRSEPVAGESLVAGGTVALVARPEQQLVEVPDVTGRSIRQAREAIGEAGLEVGRVRYRFDDLRRPYQVLSQDPEGGEEVEPGTEIELTVNEG